MTEDRRFHKRTLFLVAYLLFAVLPIYWMVNMSFKTNEEILSSFTLWPAEFTWANYKTIFTDPSWYSGYINSLIYVGINTVISLTVALPAAYAFSRYRFLGDKHVFFWLLTNRMTPPAVFLLPFFGYSVTAGPAVDWTIPEVWASVLAVGFICTALAYLIYFRLIADIGPLRSLTVTFLIPPFGILWGYLVLGETLTGGFVAGGAIVCLAVWLVVSPSRAAKPAKAQPQG